MTKRLAPIVLLLVLHFGLRVHNNTAQYAYIDEGFHAINSAKVWDFRENPGRFAYSRVLLYFWLGIFETEPIHALSVSRAAIALFSVLTGAAVYGVGRQMRDHATGLLALGLYAVLPLAVFHERMAMADPFAAAFGAVMAWRSLIFARRPSLREGGILGILIGGMTLAKLTLILMPLLPAAAALIFYEWRFATLLSQIKSWLRLYLPPLILAAIIVGLLWSPLVIPAYFARNTDRPFVLVDTLTLRGYQSHYTPQEYLRRILPLSEEFNGRALLPLVGAALATAAAVGLWQRNFWRFRVVWFNLAWIGLVATLLIFRADQTAMRYFVPVAAPLVLLLAYSVGSLWRYSWGTQLLSGFFLAALEIWLLLSALPIIRTTLTNPDDLAFTDRNYLEYKSGFIIADPSVQAAAEYLNALDPQPDHIYVTEGLCRLLYFHVEHKLTCLPPVIVFKALEEQLRADLAQNEVAYLAISDFPYPYFFQFVPGLAWSQVGQYNRARIVRPITLWAIWFP